MELFFFPPYGQRIEKELWVRKNCSSAAPTIQPLEGYNPSKTGSREETRSKTGESGVGLRWVNFEQGGRVLATGLTLGIRSSAEQKGLTALLGTGWTGKEEQGCIFSACVCFSRREFQAYQEQDSAFSQHAVTVLQRSGSKDWLFWQPLWVSISWVFFLSRYIELIGSFCSVKSTKGGFWTVKYWHFALATLVQLLHKLYQQGFVYLGQALHWSI